MADRIASAARANTERTAPHLLTPSPVPTADLLAKLNGVGVEAKRCGHMRLVVSGFGFAWMYSAMEAGPCDEPDARNAVTVAALEVLTEMGWGILPCRSERDRWCLSRFLLPTEPIPENALQPFRAPDLAAAAVEAAVRVRGVTNG